MLKKKEKIDDKFPLIINKYITYLVSIKGASEGTVKGYKNDLALLFQFLKIYYDEVFLDEDFDLTYDLHKIPINDIDINFIKRIELDDLYEFLSFIQKYRYNNANTRARKVICIRSFFKYLNAKIKVLDHNVAAELEIPKIPSRIPIYLKEEECNKLIACINSRNTLRDKCIIILFLNTGMRLSELCSINITDIKEDSIRIIGKGNKERIVYLNDICKKYIDLYIWRRALYKDKIKPGSENALFLSERKQRISKRNVETIVKNAIMNAELSDKYSVHKLRHTAASLLFKAGADIRTIQIILGHKNIATTQIYVHADENKIKDAVKINPLNL